MCTYCATGSKEGARLRGSQDEETGLEGDGT